MAASAYPNVYGLWSNMEVVGKTNLSYHLASTYAKLFPNKIVVAIDMCPQAYLSSTLLPNVSGTLHSCTTVGNILPGAQHVLY
jgi:cellulose biosynthesis protein BcsQ